MQTPMIVIFFTGNCSSLLLYAKKEVIVKFNFILCQVYIYVNVYVNADFSPILSLSKFKVELI